MITELNVQGSREFAQVRAEGIRSLRNDVFEPRKSTGSGLFAIFRCDFDQIFGQIICMRVKTLRNKNSVASRHIREKESLPVDVRRSKTLFLNVP